MKSTWLLFRSLRRHLFGGLLIELVIGFIVGQDLTPKDVKDCYVAILGPMLWGYLILVFSKLPRRLYVSPYPVSARQQAWIPMIFVGILWLEGLMGTVAGILYAAAVYHAPLFMLGRFLSFLIYLLPVVVCVASMAQPAFLQKTFVALCFLPMLVSDTGRNASWIASLAEWYGVLWPLVLGIGLFYVLVGPLLTAASDRMNPFLEALHTGPRKRKIDTVARHLPVMLLAETGIFVLIVLVVAAFLIRLATIAFDTFDKGSLLSVINCAVLASGGILFFSAYLVLDFRRIRASGFGLAASFGLLLMRSSVVLFPVSRFLGVRQGATVRCEHCGNWVFVWAPGCARCASQQADEKGLSSAEYQRPVWGSFLGAPRLVPHGMVLFYMGMFIFLTYKLEINSHEAFIYTENMPATVSRPDFVREVRRVTTNQSMTDWLQSLTGDPAMKGRIPDTFKIDAGYLNDGRIIFTIVTPLSEKPGDLPRLLMERVREKLDAPKHIFQVSIDHFTSRQFLKFGSFDQQIHWYPIPEIDGK